MMDRLTRSALIAAPSLAAAALLVAPATAQDGPAPTGEADYLEALKACQAIASDAERLSCLDASVARMVAANDAGEVQIVDKEDVTETKRKLFGFSLPKIGLFGGGDGDEDELFETTITSARYVDSKTVRFTTAEGAVWQMNNVPRRLRRIEKGDSVAFKKASLGTYFIRIDGQMGVKGKRVE